MLLPPPVGITISESVGGSPVLGTCPDQRIAGFAAAGTRGAGSISPATPARVASVTPASTTTFTTSATNPTLTSVTAAGQEGNSFASVVPVTVRYATVASPATIPAKAPARVASGTRGRLSSTA